MSEELLNSNLNEITNKQQLIQILQNEDEHYLQNFLKQQQETIKKDPDSFFIATKDDSSPIATAIHEPEKAGLLLETISTLPDEKQQAIFEQAYHNNYLPQLAYHAATHRIPVMKNLLEAIKADRPYSFFQTSPKKDKEASWYQQEGAVLKNIKSLFNAIYLEKLEFALTEHQNDCVDANPDLNGLGKSLDKYFKEHANKHTNNPSSNSRGSSTSDPAIVEAVSSPSPSNNNRSTTMSESYDKSKTNSEPNNNLLSIINRNEHYKINDLQEKIDTLVDNNSLLPVLKKRQECITQHGESIVADPLTLAAYNNDTDSMITLLDNINQHLVNKQDQKELFSDIFKFNTYHNDCNHDIYARLAQCAIEHDINILDPILNNHATNDYTQMQNHRDKTSKDTISPYYQAIDNLLKSARLAFYETKLNDVVKEEYNKSYNKIRDQFDEALRKHRAEEKKWGSFQTANLSKPGQSFDEHINKTSSNQESKSSILAKLEEFRMPLLTEEERNLAKQDSDSADLGREKGFN